MLIADLTMELQKVQFVMFMKTLGKGGRILLLYHDMFRYYQA